MKVIIGAIVVLAMSSCASTDHLSFGLKRTYSYNFINDGSSKAKDCQLECQKKETQCKALADVEYQASKVANREWWEIDIAQHLNELKEELCESQAIECVNKICHSSVEKIYLD